MTEPGYALLASTAGALVGLLPETELHPETEIEEEWR